MNLEEKVATIEANLEIIIGRLNALHAALHTLTMCYGQSRSEFAARLSDATEKLIADVVALPIAERSASEAQRVLELLNVAAHK